MTQCYVIAICNKAGGVAKTTLTRDLGYELSLHHKVLLLDADSQGCLGEFFGLSPFERPDDEMFWSIVETKAMEQPPVFSKYGLDVGLSNLSLEKLERRLDDKKNPAWLYGVLKIFEKKYDYILIDCPPHTSMVTIQALFAADGLLVPVETEPKAVAGLGKILEEFIDSNDRRKTVSLPPTKLLGIVPTKFNPNRRIHTQYLNEVRMLATSYGCHVFPPYRNYIAVPEASNQEQPLKLYDQQCPANQDVEQIAEMVSSLTSQIRKKATR
ncbi:MAG: ParA family protein [Blastocatellia bacterium]|nr:ParA family protein [Blastocatellia bacterium]